MKKKIVLLLVLTVVVVLAVAATCAAVTFASADENGVVYVHFYNGSNEYSRPEWDGKTNLQWGAYYWIDSGRVTISTGDDTDFARDDNVGKLFQINLNASQTKAVNQGKKLGLIMVWSYIDELGDWTAFWNGNKGKDLSSDRLLDVKLVNGRYDVWIIAGDKNNYTSLESARLAFERVESANFGDYSEGYNENTDARYFDSLMLQTTKPIYKPDENHTPFDHTPVDEDNDIEHRCDVCGASMVYIYKITTRIKDSTTAARMEQESTVPYKVVHIEDLWNNGLNAKVRGLNMYADFDWNADYEVEIPGVSPFRTCACKTRLFLSDKFKSDCELAENADANLGVTYTPQATTFRVWAPISTNVLVKFYRTGNELDDSKPMPDVAMTKGEKGVWTATVQRNIDGWYYNYGNYVGGDVYETVDVYATAVGVNGARSMVCNLDATNPDGWDSDLAKAKTIRETKCDTGVIWEVHVRDFSISPDSGLTYKGKYLAFTEQNTHVKGYENADEHTMLSGIAYLKELGISYVHLNPVFDFATVDEEYINNTDYTTKQNWGYDPKNYNVPEGSYATNAENGEVRINEFKQMVQALHDAGIGVIMDVVYNHTATADSYFDHTVPGYYYRQALDGKWSDEVHGMVYNSYGTAGKVAWTTNGLGMYNLSDGSGCSNETASDRAMFRRYMVDSLCYWAGEYHIDGFRFDLMAIHDVDTMNAIRTALNGLTEAGGAGILLYGEPWAAAQLGIDPSDSANTDHLQYMPGIKAFNDRMREGIKGNNDGGKGYVQGNISDDTLNRVKAGINGYFAGTDSAGNTHAITYTTSHDNYTLWDQMINTTVKQKSPTIYTEPNSVLVRKNMMAATLTMTSRGMAFMLAGEEIARTKYGNHNSYNAQDKINGFDYNRQQEFGDLLAWYKMLIKLRTDFPSFGKGITPADIYNAGENDSCLCYLFGKEGNDRYSRVYVLLNPLGKSQTLTIEGSWTIYASASGKDTINGGSATLTAYSTLILVQ